MCYCISGSPEGQRVSGHGTDRKSNVIYDDHKISYFLSRLVAGNAQHIGIVEIKSVLHQLVILKFKVT